MRGSINRLVINISVAAAAILVSPSRATALVQMDFETGIAGSGYNDVRYPGDSGTKISLSRDLTLDQSMFWRARVSYSFGDHHTVSLLAAPLRLEGSGTVPRDVTFGEAVFPAGTFVQTKYRFDSYRVTYRYDFYRHDNLRLGIGLTGKIRDAAISIHSGTLSSEKANTGFVPLVNFRADLDISRRVGLLLDGDALAAPQGRAEDVLLAVTVRATKTIQAKFGYRILEGGADNDEVYTFALVNYLVLGAVWQF